MSRLVYRDQWVANTVWGEGTERRTQQGAEAQWLLTVTGPTVGLFVAFSSVSKGVGRLHTSLFHCASPSYQMSNAHSQNQQQGTAAAHKEN